MQFELKQVHKTWSGTCLTQTEPKPNPPGPVTPSINLNHAEVQVRVAVHGWVEEGETTFLQIILMIREHIGRRQKIKSKVSL